MGKASHAKKAGKAFEELIARIEGALLPVGAIVSSPDKIMDKAGQTWREVDASIRYKLGSVPILVTIECRDRSRKADIAWIEQIVAKKSDIGAQSTIGVSVKGFSKSAKQKAAQHGIELRETQELTGADLSENGIFIRHLSITLKSCQLIFQTPKTKGEPIVFALDGSPFETDKPFILDELAGRRLTFDEMVSFLLDNHRNWPENTAESSDRSVFFPLDPNRYFVRSEDGMSAAAGINLIFVGGALTQPLQLSKAFNYLSESSQRIAQIQNWSAQLTTIQGRDVDLGVEIIFR